MKRMYLLAVISFTALVPLAVAGKEKPRKSEARPEPFREMAQADTRFAGEPWVAAKVVISDDERRIIREYVDDNFSPDNRGRKPKRLPPGLAKKVARGGELPPGWEKKCTRGSVMTREVYEQTHPLPAQVAVRLPLPPPGTITVTIGGKVVRLAKATLEILDVFDVHVRL